MKHIKTVNKPTLQKTLKTGGCGECQASCQSAKGLYLTTDFVAEVLHGGQPGL